MSCLTPKPSKIFFVYRIERREKHFAEKEFFKGKGE